MIHKCSNCYWCQQRQEIPKHIGCYADGKFRFWIAKKKYDIPTICDSWKEIPKL